MGEKVEGFSKGDRIAADVGGMFFLQLTTLICVASNLYLWEATADIEMLIVPLLFCILQTLVELVIIAERVIPCFVNISEPPVLPWTEVSQSTSNSECLTVAPCPLPSPVLCETLPLPILQMVGAMGKLFSSLLGSKSCSVAD